MDTLREAVRRYVAFLDGYFRMRIPTGADAHEAVNALLRSANPLWRELQDHEATRSFATQMAADLRCVELFNAYVTNRKHLSRSFEDYLTGLAQDLALKRVRLAPASDRLSEVDQITEDFLTFVSTRMLTFVQMAPLFNFTMTQHRLDISGSTWIAELDKDNKDRVVRAIYRPEIIISQMMLAKLQFAIFHSYAIPVSSTEIGPPDQDLALDAELALRLLKPMRAVDCGYLEHWATGWYGPGNGGARLSMEFRWPGPPYVLQDNESEVLGELIREIQYLTPSAWVAKARFFQTARGRLLRAAHEQDFRQRLLDLFICIESCLLRDGEYWRTRTQSLGAQRTATILEPGDDTRRGTQRDRSNFAHDQRNTVVHGIDRDLIGFDRTAANFDDLVVEVDGSARQVLLRCLRLIKQAGSLDAALIRLDQAEGDGTRMAELVQIIGTGVAIPLR